jgi:hypothetical protein
MFRVIRTLHLVGLVMVVAGGCPSSPPTEEKPLPGGIPLDISLQKTIGVSLLGLPRLVFRPTTGGIVVQYDVISGPCMLASARAERAGHVIAVWIDRGGDPGANCAPGMRRYDYIATATGLSPGTYEVRFIDQLGDDPGHELGRTLVTVSSGT